MNINGRTIFPLLLLGFWVYMAYRAFSDGNRTIAIVYLGIGLALTAWRLKKANA